MNLWIFSNRSPEWSKTRNAFIKQNSSCSACGSKKNLQVHHIEPVHVNATRELDMENLITLCKSCHFIFGHLMDYNSWNIDVVNDSKVYLDKVKNRPYKTKKMQYDSISLITIADSIINWIFPGVRRK